MTDRSEIFGEPFEDYPFVKLKEKEVEKAKRLAQEIYYANIFSQKGDFDKGLMSNNIGAAGELAFSKYYGLGFNDQVLHGGDDYDYKVKHVPSDTVGTIDVKTISFTGGDMLIQTSRELKADLYVLVEQRGSAYGFVGYAKRSTVAEADSHPPGVYSPVRVRRILRGSLNPVPNPSDLEPATGD